MFEYPVGALGGLRLAAGLRAERGARTRVPDFHLELIKGLRFPHPPGTRHRQSSFAELTAVAFEFRSC